MPRSDRGGSRRRHPANGKQVPIAVRLMIAAGAAAEKPYVDRVQSRVDEPQQRHQRSRNRYGWACRERDCLITHETNIAPAEPSPKGLREATTLAHNAA